MYGVIENLLKQKFIKHVKNENKKRKIDQTTECCKDVLRLKAEFEDYGWRHIAGNRSEGIQYSEKMHPDCQEEIFSASTSKGNRYRKISTP